MSEEKIILNDFIPQLKNLIQSETVFGEPYEVNEITIIPVNSVKIGFGFGNREVIRQNDASGGGGGVLLSPVAFIIIKGDTVSIQNISSGTAENLLEKIPEFMEKTVNLLQKISKKKSGDTPKNED